MGYDTRFSGKFLLNKKLDKDIYNLLVGLATTRRMKRNVGSEYGIEGEFYFEDDEHDTYFQNPSTNIIDDNKPPSSQPSLWLQWIPTKDGKSIRWDGNEKFYKYVEWLEYLLRRILLPRGYYLSGVVKFQGEDDDDRGTIEVNIQSEEDVMKCMLSDEPIVKKYYSNQVY